MPQPKSYGPEHPMVAQRTGDPARGEFIPKSAQKAAKSKGKRRK